MLTDDQRLWLLNTFEEKRALTTHNVYYFLEKVCPAGIQRATKQNIADFFKWLGCKVDKRYHPHGYSLVGLNRDKVARIRSKGKPYQLSLSNLR